MFVKYNKEEQNIPIKIWMKQESDVEVECFQQVKNISNLPFVFRHVALMADGHMGVGAAIGSVFATNNVVIPSAVGVDIGCGMRYIQTNIPVALFDEYPTLKNDIVGCLMRNIPVGFNKHNTPQSCSALNNHEKYENLGFAKELYNEINEGYYSVGTMGGGNHFLELQVDENKNLAIMLHSGSRNFGFKICKCFDNVAKQLNEQWFSKVPVEQKLAFLPMDTNEGKSYFDWMSLALEFAFENRMKMMESAKSIVFNHIKKYTGFSGIELGDEIDVHHNYAAMENHFGKNVLVHRKGAIRARAGELGIIPGSMGSSSYIVRGKGHEDSFQSASHGAGRAFSRTKAKELFTVQSVMEELKDKGIVLGKHKKEDVAEECTKAYKDIDQVMENQVNLVDVVKKLRAIAVIKG